MADFLITQITLYPWFTWLLVFFAAMGVWFAAVWAYKIQLTVFAWLGYRRQVWLAKAAVRRQLIDDPLWDCAVCRDREALLAEALATEDDPPGYEHPDGGDDLDYCEHGVIRRTCTRCEFDWDGPPDDWSPVTTWGPPVLPHHEMAGLAEVLKRAHDLGLLDDDQLPDGPPVEAPEAKCTNRDCDLFGFLHRPPCHLAPTQPAACYVDQVDHHPLVSGLKDGPAMPPQPVREYLHPAIMDDLAERGFSEHETTDGAVDSIVMRAVTAEVEAMVTDGIIPADDTGRSQA